MKKRKFLIGKILSVALAFILIIQAQPLTVVALSEALGDALGKVIGETFGSNATSTEKTQGEVLPDVDNDAWEIPEATKNPNNVNMTINNGIVYNDHVYQKLMQWGYLTGYQDGTDPYTGH